MSKINLNDLQATLSYVAQTTSQRANSTAPTPATNIGSIGSGLQPAPVVIMLEE